MNACENNINVNSKGLDSDTNEFSRIVCQMEDKS